MGQSDALGDVARTVIAPRRGVVTVPIVRPIVHVGVLDRFVTQRIGRRQAMDQIHA